MAENEPGTLTDAVNALAGEITGLRGEIQGLDVYGRRTRTLIWRQWIAYGIVFLLAVGLGFVAVNARHTAQVATRNTVNAVDACNTANKARKIVADLWDYILALPPTHPLTAQEQAAVNVQVAALRARIATAYAQQDCSKLAAPK